MLILCGSEMLSALRKDLKGCACYMLFIYLPKIPVSEPMIPGEISDDGEEFDVNQAEGEGSETETEEVERDEHGNLIQGKERDDSHTKKVLHLQHHIPGFASSVVSKIAKHFQSHCI